MKSLNIFRNPFRIIVIISLFFVGCVSDIAIALETVKVGFSPVVATGPLFLGIERGYFNEAGIKNELVEFRTSGLRLQALMAGDLDVSTSGFGADIINAIIEGAPIRIVADTGQEKEGFTYAYWMVRKDLWDSGAVRDYKDFKGKTISSGGTKGSLNYMLLLGALNKGGLTIKDINFVLVQHPQVANAFATRAIDIAYTLEPFNTKALDMGVGVILAPTIDVVPSKGIQTAIIMMNTNFIKKKRNVAQTWMNAFLKGVSDYNIVLSQGIKKEDFYGILAKFTKLDVDILRRGGFPFIDPRGRLNEEATLYQLEYFNQEGVLKNKINSINEIVDYSLLPK